LNKHDINWFLRSTVVAVFCFLFSLICVKMRVEYGNEQSTALENNSFQQRGTTMDSLVHRRLDILSTEVVGGAILILARGES